MLNVKSLLLSSVAAIMLAGCSSTPPIQQQDRDPTKSVKPKAKPPEKNPTPAVDSPELVAGVSSFFKAKCSSCHGGEARGQLQDVLDVTELRNRNLIGDTADDSVLFRLINDKHQENEFDPRTKKKVVLPTEQEINFVRLWLDAGAPALRGNRTRISLDDYLSILRNDASDVLRASQNELVYVDFHAVYNNNRYSDAEMQAFANATLKLLNHLDVESTSTNRTGVRVVTDSNNVPMAVRFDPQRFNLDKIEDIERFVILPNDRQDINNRFQCDIPAIPVLDFLLKAASDDIFNVFGNNGAGTFEAAYSNITFRKLLIKEGFLQPDQLVFDPISKDQFIANGFTNVSNVDMFQVLESVDPINFNRQVLDTLYNEGNDDERVVRGAMLQSNVSAANRVIDRLAQSDGGITYWSFDALTFNNVNGNDDFFEASFVGPANPPGNELVRPTAGFQPFNIDGGELIVQLSNRMLGYAVYRGDFRLLTNPPTQAVQNIGGNNERGSFISVAACHSCHSKFTIPFPDAVLPTLLGSKNGREFGEAGFAFKFAQTQDDWDFTFSDDAANFTDLLRDVYISRSETGELGDGIWSLGSQYLNDLSNDDIVAELGLFDVDTLKNRIDNNTDLSADLAQTFGGGLSRENFIANYQVLVEQVAGSNEDFLRGCVGREASDPGDFGDQDDGSENGSNDGEEGNVGNQ